jgi:MarR family transcriptional repressor of mepA
MSTLKEQLLREKFGSRMGSQPIFMIGVVGHLLGRRGNRELARSGFSLQIEQFPLLFVIYLAGADFLSQQDIANMLKKDKSGIQRSIRTLERDGYLRVTADDEDRRRNLIQLTPAGKLVVEKAIETTEQIDQQITNQLAPEEVSALLTTLRKIAALLN